ncbi:MAG: RNA polymerase sigma factor [Angelakisella sp.]
MLLFAGIEDEVQESTVRQPKIDEQLFVRIGNDDRGAFEELYRLTERTLYAFALSILQNPHDTQDVVQDVYLKVRAAAHLYEPRGKPLAWLFTITRNLCNNRLRQNKTDYLPEEDFADNLRFSYVEDSDDRMILSAALKLLAEPERQVLLLHLVSGMHHREIAQSLGQPLSTVLSRYHRALGKLKKQLTERGVFGA